MSDHKVIIASVDGMKTISSENYNSCFNEQNGYFARWGKTYQEDPGFCPFGPEICDMEISTACSGLDGIPCRFCYKSNTPKGEYMSFDTFKKVFNTLTSEYKVLTQIAFGIGDIDANPDIWKIFQYCRDNNVVPNVTINGARLTDEIFNNLVKYCGAIAVSRYKPVDYCYNAVKRLTDAGMEQINIHILLSAETYEDCLQVIEDKLTDPRLEKLNAIVFLSLKPQGRGKSYTPLKDEKKYQRLIYLALEKGVSIGFDSCSAPMFLNAVKEDKNYGRYKTLAEPCESYLFSIYVNVKGETVPCSFLEGKENPIDLTKENMALEDWWMAPSTIAWREKLLATGCKDNCLVKGCRQCPIYDIY
jgi:MoaA/NifB/PqqE/SkfB family radical SAM enzyme